jgi:hypothetical protein
VTDAGGFGESDRPREVLIHYTNVPGTRCTAVPTNGRL